jgi:hypothetical protein
MLMPLSKIYLLQLVSVMLVFLMCNFHYKIVKKHNNSIKSSLTLSERESVQIVLFITLTELSVVSSLCLIELTKTTDCTHFSKL